MQLNPNHEPLDFKVKIVEDGKTKEIDLDRYIATVQHDLLGTSSYNDSRAILDQLESVIQQLEDEIDHDQ